jgi:putative ABC transport system permease protein
MLRNYVLTAYKVFLRRKLFTAINLLCIVLTLVVLMVVTALLDNAFHPSSGAEAKSDRFLQIGTVAAKAPDGNGSWRSPLGFKLIDKYLKPLKSVRTVAAVTGPQTVSVYQQGRVTELLLRHNDADYWKVLDFMLLAGRLTTADDDAQGRFAAVINLSSARKLFPGDTPAAALGQKISVGGQPFEVVGVVQDELHLNAFADIWVPITTFPTTGYRQQLMDNFTALLLADSPAGLAAIQREVQQVAATVQVDDPTQWSRVYFWADSKLDYFARGLFSNDDQPDSGAATLVTLVVVLMLLFMLLPALNLVNLNTGRILERSAEIGVRKAFGASNTQLLGQLMLENVLLCAVGGLLGLLCAQAVLWWLEASHWIPYLKVSLNFAVFGYGLLITLVFGLLSGLIPAWRMSRLDLVRALKGGV